MNPTEHHLTQMPIVMNNRYESSQVATIYLAVATLNLAWGTGFFFASNGLNRSFTYDTTLKITKLVGLGYIGLAWGAMFTLALFGQSTGMFAPSTANVAVFVAYGGAPVVLGVALLWLFESKDNFT